MFLQKSKNPRLKQESTLKSVSYLGMKFTAVLDGLTNITTKLQGFHRELFGKQLKLSGTVEIVALL